MSIRLETHPRYRRELVEEFFYKRGWPVSVLSVSAKEVHLMPVHAGAAFECSDGRFDNLIKRKMRGPRVFGGINVVMATITGGGEEGLEGATDLVAILLGLAPGTHSAEKGDCGYVKLWENGKLESAKYPFISEHEKLATEAGIKLGKFLARRLIGLRGWHFRLSGEHEEEAVRFNPFRNTTDVSGNGKRFIVDDWALAYLEIPLVTRCLAIAESVEQLKPDAARIEIIDR